MDLFKNLIIFGMGVAIGSAVTYFMVKESIEQSADSEMDSFYNFYKSKMEKISGEENSEKVDEESPEERKQAFEEYSSIVGSYTKKEKEYTNYSSYSLEDAIDEDKTAHPDDKSEQPYTIDQYLYEEDEDYAKEELFYYDGNGVLATENEEEVDILEYIGDAGSYELITYNEPMIWVRNESKETDFAVTRLYSSYNKME